MQTLVLSYNSKVMLFITQLVIDNTSKVWYNDLNKSKL